MKKRILTTYLVLLFPVFVLIAFFSVYQIFYHGYVKGIYSILLTWSMYILCIPAAHGRILLGAPAKVLFKKPIFPEIYFWSAAAALNIITLILFSFMYEETIPTHLLYRIFTVPTYRWILFVAALGTWYRLFIGNERYEQHKRLHTLVRHLILLTGIFTFFYLTHQEVIIMINATANG